MVDSIERKTFSALTPSTSSKFFFEDRTCEPIKNTIANPYTKITTTLKREKNIFKTKLNMQFSCIGINY